MIPFAIVIFVLVCSFLDRENSFDKLEPLAALKQWIIINNTINNSLPILFYIAFIHAANIYIHQINDYWNLILELTAIIIIFIFQKFTSKNLLVTFSIDLNNEEIKQFLKNCLPKQNVMKKESIKILVKNYHTEKATKDKDFLINLWGYLSFTKDKILSKQAKLEMKKRS